MDPEFTGNLIVMIAALIFLIVVRVLMAMLLDEPIKDKNCKYCNDCKYCCNALPKQEGCLKWEDEKEEKEKKKEKKDEAG